MHNKLQMSWLILWKWGDKMEIIREQLNSWIARLKYADKDSSIFNNTIKEMEDAIQKGHTKNISDKDNDIIKCPICRADMINLGIHEGRRYYRCEDCNWVVR